MAEDLVLDHVSAVEVVALDQVNGVVSLHQLNEAAFELDRVSAVVVVALMHLSEDGACEVVFQGRLSQVLSPDHQNAEVDLDVPGEVAYVGHHHDGVAQGH